MPRIHTLYLLPHSHTDVGYSHDPVVTLELHDRFLDRAIAMCERTREYPEGAGFRWTVEVFSSLLHWWEHRGPADRARLRACLERGEMDVGARYLNGTELYAPEDVRWELAELERLVGLTGYRPVAAIQNDVNGFPLALARPLAAAGVEAVIMGLNTTMGRSPFPRCSAFRWDVGAGRDLLVWHGWIYNRIKIFCHLDRLAADLPGKLSDFLASLPADYPYDFAMTSATIGDNIGPFPALPDQVRQFNERSPGIRLRLATFAEFARVVARARERLPVRAGHWTDAWTFGAGSMPQMVASIRRAQRRLRLVEQIRARGWAGESGGTLTLDRGRRALAYACEHTCDSHTSAGEQCGSSDSLRQKAQIQVEASVAESVSMALLRDHLAAMAAELPSEPVSVLAVNPHPWPLTFDYLSERKGLLAFAASRRPEHLYQFDREPTFETLAAAGTFGVRNVIVPAGERVCAPLADLPPPSRAALPAGAGAELAASGAVLAWNGAADGRSRLSWQPAGGPELLANDAEFAPFAAVEERPQTPFQRPSGRAAEMDPADCDWNPDLRFARRMLAGGGPAGRRMAAGEQQTLEWSYTAADPLRRLAFTLDARQPRRLLAATGWRFDADPAQRAYYLALPLALPGPGECEYWVDNCGDWFRAETDQLPNTCNSFYQAWRGVAVSRAGHTLYIAAPDTTLFQFGGFTFGRAPSARLERRRPFVALWIYNNFWGTNFPSVSPGLFTARFALEYGPGAFDPAAFERLDAVFDTDYLTHPVA